MKQALHTNVHFSRKHNVSYRPKMEDYQNVSSGWPIYVLHLFLDLQIVQYLQTDLILDLTHDRLDHFLCLLFVLDPQIDFRIFGLQRLWTGLRPEQDHPGRTARLGI